MGFFDLNIPYHESDRNVSRTTKTSLKNTRLKLVTKSMELGYSGVAYNHTIEGSMSESDRCSIPLFTLSSIVKLAPLLSSIKFHRQLLNVPISSPFRQYTRLTVIIDNPKHAAALNSGNPVLKTYDFIAVRPVNQNAFEQACQIAQVDIISIDFSVKLPFRLKKSMVKAAVERGLYFEITYSSLIFNAQARREMLSNAKLLVDWTRGKNLIISSGAPSVTELRGPYDAANLSSLLGFTMERSKEAISKNCRSLIADVLRKKHFFKDVIKVEKLPPGEAMRFDDWLKWDPISSAEGDLSLDDMGKSFSASCDVLKASKAIDFMSTLNGIPSHGLQIKDIMSSTLAVAEPFALSKNLTTELDSEMPEEPLSFCSLQKMEPALAEGLVEPSGSDLGLLVSLSCDMSNVVSSERNGVDAVAIKELVGVQAVVAKNEEPRSMQALSYTASDERTVLPSNVAATTCAENIDIISSHDQCASAGKPILENDCSSSPFNCDQSKLVNSVGLDIFTQSGTVCRSLAKAIRDNSEELHGIEAERVGRSNEELHLASCDESFHDNCREIERSSEEMDAPNQFEAKRVSRNELPPALCEESFHDNCMRGKRFLEMDTSILQIDGLPVEKSDNHIIVVDDHLICNEASSTTSNDFSYEKMADGEYIIGAEDLSFANLDEPDVTDPCSHRKTKNVYPVAPGETVEHDTITSQAGTNNKLPDNSPLVRGGVKRKTSQRISLFPFKRLISPRPLRKKARK